MDIKKHIILSLIITIIYEIISSYRIDIWSLIIFSSGWVIDFDHQIDLIINYGKIELNIKKAMKMHNIEEHLYIFLHCYEWLLVLILLYNYVNINVIFFIGLNYLIHLIIDTITNKVRPFTYSFIYRWIKSFNNNFFLRR